VSPEALSNFFRISFNVVKSAFGQHAVQIEVVIMQANSKVTKRCITKTFIDNFSSSQHRTSALMKVKFITV
jgi:hypothetical protein